MSAIVSVAPQGRNPKAQGAALVFQPRVALVALKGRDSIAQRAALGDDSPITLVALKGRDSVGRTEPRGTSLRRAGESHPVGVPGFRSPRPRAPLRCALGYGMTPLCGYDPIELASMVKQIAS